MPVAAKSMSWWKSNETDMGIGSMIRLARADFSLWRLEYGETRDARHVPVKRISAISISYPRGTLKASRSSSGRSDGFKKASCVSSENVWCARGFCVGRGTYRMMMVMLSRVQAYRVFATRVLTGLKSHGWGEFHRIRIFGRRGDHHQAERQRLPASASASCVSA